MTVGTANHGDHDRRQQRQGDIEMREEDTDGEKVQQGTGRKYEKSNKQTNKID